MANIFAGEPADRSGVRVTVEELDLDGTPDVLAGSARAGADGFRVRGYPAGELLAGRATERYLPDPFSGELVQVHG